MSHATEHAGEGSVRMADAGSRVADACDRFRGVLRVGPCTPGGDEDRGDRLSQRDFRAESRHGVATSGVTFLPLLFLLEAYACFGRSGFYTQSHIHIHT